MTLQQNSSHILLIDDDQKMQRLLIDYLGPHSHLVTPTHDGQTALRMVAARKWDLIILDVALKGFDGLELLKRIRAASSAPLLVLTTRNDEADRIVGLEIGADDYVNKKTCSSRELLARIRVLLRRPPYSTLATTAGDADDASEIRCGALAVNMDSRRAFIGDTEIALTPVEFDLLASLAASKDKVKTREQLLADIRSGYAGVNVRSIDVHVSLLRGKLASAPKGANYIRTVRKIGYLLVAPPA